MALLDIPIPRYSHDPLRVYDLHARQSGSWKRVKIIIGLQRKIDQVVRVPDYLGDCIIQGS